MADELLFEIDVDQIGAFIKTGYVYPLSICYAIPNKIVVIYR